MLRFISDPQIEIWRQSRKDCAHLSPSQPNHRASRKDEGESF